MTSLKKERRNGPKEMDQCTRRKKPGSLGGAEPREEGRGVKGVEEERSRKVEEKRPKRRDRRKDG